jgi:hypothetical protein
MSVKVIPSSYVTPILCYVVTTHAACSRPLQKALLWAFALYYSMHATGLSMRVSLLCTLLNHVHKCCSLIVNDTVPKPKSLQSVASLLTKQQVLKRVSVRHGTNLTAPSILVTADLPQGSTIQLSELCLQHCSVPRCS